LFEDISELVSDQQICLDSIETLVEETCINVRNGNNELETGMKHKKSYRKRVCYLTCCLIILLSIILGILDIVHKI
jgi:t-SNARE complex subunit (syntaxin)